MQEFRGEVHKVFMHSPPKFLQKPFSPMMMINFLYKIKNLILALVSLHSRLLTIYLSKIPFHNSSSRVPWPLVVGEFGHVGLIFAIHIDTYLIS